jgi:hypothetical protein
MLPLFFTIMNLNNLAPYGWVAVIEMFVAALFALNVYAIIRILLRIRQLNRI